MKIMQIILNKFGLVRVKDLDKLKLSAISVSSKSMYLNSELLDKCKALDEEACYLRSLLKLVRIQAQEMMEEPELLPTMYEYLNDKIEELPQRFGY